jgi:uncharacterized membrane protein (DUF2068 family)
MQRCSFISWTGSMRESSQRARRPAPHAECDRATANFETGLELSYTHWAQRLSVEFAVMLKRKSDNWIRLIAMFKLVKGVLLLLVGAGAATLLYRNTADQLFHWTVLLSLRQENRYVGRFLSWVMGFNRRDLGVFEVSSFAYAALLLTEGVGLLLLKRWAEYLTVVITASFIPLELLSDVRRFNTTKSLILFLNVAAVWYLSARLWADHGASD